MSQEISQIDLNFIRNNLQNTFQNEASENPKLFYHLSSMCFYLVEKYNLDPQTDFFSKTKNLFPFIKEYYQNFKDESFQLDKNVLKTILGGTTKQDNKKKWGMNSKSFESELKDDLKLFQESFLNLKKPTKMRKNSQPICECGLCYKTNFILHFIHNKEDTYFPVPKSSTFFQKIKIFRDDQVGIATLFEFINFSFEDGGMMAVLVYEFVDEQDQMWGESKIRFVKSYTNLKLNFGYDGDWFMDYSDDEVFRFLDEGKILGIFYEDRMESVTFRKVDGVYVMTSSVNMNDNDNLVFLEE